MDNVMTVEHPKWEEFMEQMEGPEGCDFQEGENPPETISWKCDSKPERPIARKFLVQHGVDVEASLKYFEQHGGYCDCEIVFNVERKAENPKPKRRRAGHSRRSKRGGKVSRNPRRK